MNSSIKSFLLVHISSTQDSIRNQLAITVTIELSLDNCYQEQETLHPMYDGNNHNVNPASGEIAKDPTCHRRSNPKHFTRTKSKAADCSISY